MRPHYGSIASLLSSCLMSANTYTHELAPVTDNIQSRLTSLDVATITQHKYIACSYDVLTNLTLNYKEVGLVLSRGLTVCLDGDEVMG